MRDGTRDNCTARVLAAHDRKALPCHAKLGSRRSAAVWLRDTQGTCLDLYAESALLQPSLQRCRRPSSLRCHPVSMHGYRCAGCPSAAGLAMQRGSIDD